MTKPAPRGDSDPPRAACEGLPARAAEVLAGHLDEPLPAGLYLVATPIGNLADISLRALSVLARADMVCCEDTRHTGRLLAHYAIAAELSPYHEHNAQRERPRLLARLRAGFSVALVSDAGTPLVSDPGHKLVRLALERGVMVTAVPGPSAALAALTSAGLPSDRFFFEGFLPAKAAARRKRLAALAAIPATLVLFEAPSRLAATLRDAADLLGPREGAVAKELTKLHERVERGTLDALARSFAERDAVKGEYVILVAPAGPAEISDATIRARLETALAEASFRDAVRAVAAGLGVKRSRVYAIGLALTGGEE